jgi:hypothetical protein
MQNNRLTGSKHTLKDGDTNTGDTDMTTYTAGQIAHYNTGSEVLEVRVFRTCARKVWIDHRAFSRARIVGENSPHLSPIGA